MSFAKTLKKVLVAVAAVAVSTMGASSVPGQYAPPAGYYSSADGKSGAALQTALYNIIKGHTKKSYTQAWTALREIDQDPANANNILCIYSRRSIPKTAQDGSSSATYVWNREHSWPNSYGFGGQSSWAPYTDLFALYASEKGINSARGNKTFNDVASPTQTYTVFGMSDLNKTNATYFEPHDDVKGDVARSMFYMAVRYEGASSTEPNLILVNTSISTGEPKMAMLSALMEWHAQDPVSDRERRRNHLIYTNWQFNRNPFIDNPNYACLIWGGAACGGATPTASPTPTPTPTATATPAPTATATPAPTATATPAPTATPVPTATPTPAPGGGALSSGVQISGSVAQGAWAHYYIDLPSNVTRLDIVQAGSGDADLYVRQGSQPTSSSWHFRPYANGSAETVAVTTSTNPAVASGRWYISVNGYSASNYTLTATITTGSAPTATPTPTPTPSPTPSPTAAPGNQTLLTVGSTSVAQGSWRNYSITVPAGATQVVISMAGSGDGDLYVKKGTAYATLTSYDFRPYLDGSNETVTITTTTSPAVSAGAWQVSVYGYTAATFTLSAVASF